MILVYFLLGLITLSFITLLLSTIRIVVDNVNLVINEYEYKKFNSEFKYNFRIELCLFNKIPIIKIKLNEQKLKKIKSKLNQRKLENIKHKIKEDKQMPKKIEKLKIKLTKLNLDAEIDTQSLILTTGIVTIFSSAISIVLPKLIDKNSINNCKYKITPLYTNKNMVKIDFNCIINVKIVHIIFINYLNKSKISYNFYK